MNSEHNSQFRLISSLTFVLNPKQGSAGWDESSETVGETSEDEDIEQLFWDVIDLGTRTTEDIRNRDVLRTPDFRGRQIELQHLDPLRPDKILLVYISKYTLYL